MLAEGLKDKLNSETERRSSYRALHSDGIRMYLLGYFRLGSEGKRRSESGDEQSPVHGA